VVRPLIEPLGDCDEIELPDEKRGGEGASLELLFSSRVAKILIEPLGDCDETELPSEKEWGGGT
jgi:hypothetical protein